MALGQVFGAGGDPRQGMSGSETATATSSGGMMPYAALGSYLLGTGLDMYGQHQGAKAMEEAARRQLAEQEAFNRQRNALATAELARRQSAPVSAVQAAGTGYRADRAMRTVRPAAVAGGRALGVNAAGVNAVQTNLLPSIRVGAQQGASRDRVRRDRDAMTMLGMDTSDVDRRAAEAMSTYDTEDNLAGMTGQSLRLGGGLLKLGGQAGLSYAMQRPR